MIEVAIGMVGLALTVLTIILGYIWRANSRLAKTLLEGVKMLMEGQKTLMEGQKTLMEGQERLQRGLEGIASMVKDVHEGQREMAELLIKACERLTSK